MKKTNIFASILLLALSATMIIPVCESQTMYNSGNYLTLPTSIPTYLYAWAGPDPIGINQVGYVNAIFSKPPPTSHGLLGDMFLDITIVITDPDGIKTTLGPHDGGMIGGWSTPYTPTKVGTYTIQAFYPGQTLTGTNPYNNNASTMDYHLELKGSKMLPSNSTITTWNVQKDPVTAPYQTTPLPTEYWQRPIMALNWYWGSNIASNWLGLDATGFCTSGKYDASGCYQPYGTAPNTAHILWQKSTREGGQPGGPIPADPSTQFSSTSVVINMYDGAIIMNGIAYYTDHASWSGQVTGWEAIDLKTGATVWSKPAGVTGTETLKCGQIFDFHNAQEYGSIAYLYTTPDSAGVTRVYDAWTGTLQANLTSSRNLALICDDSQSVADRQATAGNVGRDEQIGGLLGWYIDGANLKRWNSTYLFTTTGTNLQDRTKVNAANYNWTSGVDQVIPLPKDSNLVSSSGASLFGISRITKEVILLRFSPTFYYQGSNFGWQVTMGIDAVTGAKMWGPINQTLPLFENTEVICARDGKYVLYNKDVNQMYGYSLNTGEKLWGPVNVLYNGNSALDQYCDIAYDKVYMWDTGGIVQAYSMETGARVWNWSRGSSGFDDPRGIYEFFGYNTHSIADGKLFLQEGFMYTPPLHPARRVVLNCTTGELVWDVLSYSARSGSPIADGILTEWDSYNCQIFAFGKGPTRTTVNAPDTASLLGSVITIKGTVTDTSAGAQQNEQASRFPNGLPAVSDASMTQWMEYVYKQQSKPTNTTGVMVNLSVLDSNNNYRNIGTTTSDDKGFFSFDYKPDIPGAYKVYATFEGSESYWGSSAENAFTVEAPDATPSPQPEQASPPTEMYIVGTGIAVILAIAVGFAVTIIILKKRP